MAVRSTAFLLRIAEVPCGMGVTKQTSVCEVANSALNNSHRHPPKETKLRARGNQMGVTKQTLVCEVANSALNKPHRHPPKETKLRARRNQMGVTEQTSVCEVANPALVDIYCRADAVKDG